MLTPATVHNPVVLRTPAALALVAVSCVLALAACSSSSSGSTAAGGSTGKPSPAPAQSYTQPPASTGVAPAYVWCTDLAKSLGAGLQANAVQATSVLGLTKTPVQDLAQKTWPDQQRTVAQNTELGFCAIGRPLTDSTPSPTPVSTCPAGQGTVTLFPATRAYLVAANGKHVEVTGAGALKPQPVIRCK